MSHLISAIFRLSKVVRLPNVINTHTHQLINTNTESAAHRNIRISTPPAATPFYPNSLKSVQFKLHKGGNNFNMTIIIRISLSSLLAITITSISLYM